MNAKGATWCLLAFKYHRLPLSPELNSVIEAFIIKMAASIPVHTDETFALLAFDNESSRVKRSFSSSSHISSPWGSGRAAAGEL